jgi:hypothetical protein
MLTTFLGCRGLWAQKALDLPKTVTEALDRSVAGGERAIFAVARAMPSDRYSFAPTAGESKGVRNFAQMVKHVAADNYVNGAALLGEPVSVEVGNRENGPDALIEKTAVLKFVEDSFIYLRKGVKTVTEKNLMQAVSYPGGGQVTRLYGRNGSVGSRVRSLWPDGGIPANEWH